MKGRCLPLLILSITVLVWSITADETHSHKLVKRQSPPRTGGGAVPLSRSRQFPSPEELADSEEYDNSEDEETEKSRMPAFRGRQPPPSEEEYTDDYTYTEAPKLTTPVPQKPTARTVVFNNRFAARPRFGSQSTARPTSETTAPKPSTAAAAPPGSRIRSTPAQSQRLDVVAEVGNRAPAPRSPSRSIAVSRTGNENDSDKKADAETSSRRTGNNQRVRSRGRPRARSTTTTTTTTTTTAPPPPPEEYYYYYEDEDESKNNQPIATTSSTTTTTTTTQRPRPAISRPRPANSRSRSTSRPVKVNFDPESQFAPPPDAVDPAASETSSTKKFSTTSTVSPAENGGIPSHLTHMYRPREDGRFIDFLRDPNRPRELKGFDLTDYPFYIMVPEDIDFACEDKKDGYYASIAHRCQLFHYCFANARYDFLCANYTLYDQTTFTCRFANNVDCPNSAKYFYRNDDLWKETTSKAPETTTKRRRKSTPKEEEYEYEEYDDEYEDEEVERRRRPAKRRRNRRKNKPKNSDEE